MAKDLDKKKDAPKTVLAKKAGSGESVKKESVKKDSAKPDGARQEAKDAAAAARPKKLPPGSVKLQFAGELILVRCPDKTLKGLFRRFDALFETLANMPREERVLNYKFLNALMLTSLAKKAESQEKKRELFALKNDLFVAMANSKEHRRQVMFRYLISKNFRVLKFCDECTRKNTEANIDRHEWKFCTTCDVDRNFYNVLAMQHNFKNGSAQIFLSNDQMPRIQGLTITHKGKLEESTEEAKFDRFAYNVRNLDAFEVESVVQMHKKLLAPSKT